MTKKPTRKPAKQAMRQAAHGDRGASTPRRDRRPLVLTGMALAAIAAVIAFALVRPGSSPITAWSRLGTEDVHSLAFVAGDPQRLLFGHHGGILATVDGGKTWDPLGTRSDAMSLGVVGTDSVVLAGHEVFAESRDGGQTWADIPADLPSLDIHGFVRDPSDPARMWVYLAIGGFWESVDSGRTWEQIQQQNVIFPVAIASGSGTLLVGVTATGIARSDDGGRTWKPAGDPELYPITGLAATTDGSVLIVSGPDAVARSVDGGASWARLPFEGQPAVVAVADGGRSIAVVTRSTEFFRSDDGGATWPGP